MTGVNYTLVQMDRSSKDNRTLVALPRCLQSTCPAYIMTLTSVMSVKPLMMYCPPGSSCRVMEQSKHTANTSNARCVWASQCCSCSAPLFFFLPSDVGHLATRKQNDCIKGWSKYSVGEAAKKQPGDHKDWTIWWLHRSQHVTKKPVIRVKSSVVGTMLG